MTTDKTITFHDNGPDSHGRRFFTLTWTEPNGFFRPELSKEDGKPVGYRRGQCFNCPPERFLAKGFRVTEER